MSKDASRRGGISSWCKECRKDNSRKWKKLYPERAEISRLNRIEKYKENLPGYMETRNNALKFRYGLSNDDYNAILNLQNYQCAICKRDSNTMSYFLHVDHCHSTGKVRGLLCAPCNVFLGYTKDNPEIFGNAIKYLQKESEK